MTTWHGPPPPNRPALDLAARLRIGVRLVPLAILIFGGLALLLICRLIERPFYGLRRPVTPRITQTVCRGALGLVGLRLDIAGRPMTGTGAMVANHSSWLDIFALNACAPVYFVSKDEVADWPGIGWLARATGTIFIRRNPRDSRAQRYVLAQRLRAGHRLLFFPEGTSTDGRRVLPFKTTLFAAFFDDDLRDRMQVQPVALRYHAPQGADPAVYAWWGDMAFGPHLIGVLALPLRGRVQVTFHDPLAVAAFSDRKSLARAAETRVRGAELSE
ncbi:1-acyl-sn-glycerol-3-phosphate acyltransferase [Maribius pontilimi]|uniref:1-acyl-sn-glycerol-3-phosphate acyltransferase n=1 Tax=Palleronia pontilimi TaxID=1964209 RepID=A0A934IBZ8_9RHOB|nr:lysophospholipid acyltransferase family protein [Palleronia pontilimi]MBJ3762861.1 1-acyl-sn-glycerol-3-phosphate acyltransferase [Palleronia pontilimi]